MPDESANPIPAKLDPFGDDHAPDVDLIPHDDPHPDKPEDSDTSVVPQHLLP